MLHVTSQSAGSDDRSVSLVLELHHRRIDELLDRVEIAVEVGNWSDARQTFAQFEIELEEHMRVEEELVFPAFEVFARAPGGPTAGLRAEHREIRGLVSLLEQFLGDQQPIDYVTTALEVLLAAHEANEERTIFPLFERHAAPEVYAALNLELGPLVDRVH